MRRSLQGALLVVTVAGGVAGAVALRRRYEAVQATGSLSADVDLSGAPLGDPLRAPKAVPAGDARVLAPSWEPAPLGALAGWTPEAPQHPAARLLAYAWAAPLTLAGVLLGTLSGARPDWRDGVLLYAGVGGVGGAFLRARGFQATALGHAVLATVDPDERLMSHELVHVRHAERLGIFAGLLYALLYPVYGYARHPMERAARLAARRFRGAPA